MGSWNDALNNLRNGKATFGDAVEALKKGNLVARSGWNGKGMFVFQRPADVIDLSVAVGSVKSLPQTVKDYLAKNHKTTGVHFLAYFCMYAADGSIVNGWLASQTDMQAEDWCIVEQDGQSEK